MKHNLKGKEVSGENNPLATIVLSVDARMVETVIVNGKTVLKKASTRIEGIKIDFY